MILLWKDTASRQKRNQHVVTDLALQRSRYGGKDQVSEIQEKASPLLRGIE